MSGGAGGGIWGWGGDDRGVHSFPTRRSSDLGLAGMIGLFPTAAPPFMMTFLNGGAAVRSEEHTSELQSLRHLVCRLLLEKKKHLVIVPSAIDSPIRGISTSAPILLSHLTPSQ